MKASRACGSYVAFMIALWAGSAHGGWTPPLRISDEATAYNPRIVAIGDTIHVVYWRGAFTSTYYLRSEDGGNSWSEPFHLPDTTYTSNNVMPILRSEESNIAVIWRGTLRGGALAGTMVLGCLITMERIGMR
jgi:hypothetical protein